LTGIVTVTGIVIYGILRIVYFSFYAHFGLKPEDVGLNYVETLSQSISGIVVFAVIMSVLLATLFVLTAFNVIMIVSAAKFTWEAIRNAKRDPSAIIAVAFLLTIILLIWAGERYAPAITKVILNISYGVTVLMITYAALLFLVKRLKERRARNSKIRALPDKQVTPQRQSAKRKTTATSERERRDLLDRASLRKVAFVGALILLAVFGFLLFIARGDAERVGRGGAVREVLANRIPIVSWGAETASLTPIGDDSSKALGTNRVSCVMYLGHAQGHVVVVFPSSSEPKTLRIPADKVLLTITPHRDQCPVTD
jgi:hypothetical protein